MVFDPTGREIFWKEKTWNHKHNTTVRATTMARPNHFILRPG
jgi:hypothetical protein